MRIVVLLIAFVSAFVAIWFLFFMPELSDAPRVGGNDATEVEPEIRMVEILVMTASVERGTPVTAEDMAWTEWPADHIPENSLSRLEDEKTFDELVGMAPRSDIEAGDPVRLSRFGDRSGSMASLEYDLPSGYRAISIPIDAITAAGGFVLPGSYVDVLHIHSPGVGPSETRIISGNTRVIALDQRQGVEEDQASTIARVATLEVTIDQARRISAAERDGKIVLALRSIADRNELTREYEDRETVPVRIISGGDMNIRMLD